MPAPVTSAASRLVASVMVIPLEILPLRISPLLCTLTNPFQNKFNNEQIKESKYMDDTTSHNFGHQLLISWVFKQFHDYMSLYKTMNGQMEYGLNKTL